ncbi:MAG: hypothetical protein ACRC4W_08085 [Treponemataceae bacterium]
MIKYFLVLFFLSSCSLVGFDFFSDFETVVINLPEIPTEKKELFSFSSWSVSYFDKNNKQIKKNLPLWQKELTLHVIKNQINPILITAELANSNIQFMPAGAIYPYDSINKRLTASWKNGFATQIADSILRNSADPEDSRKFLMFFNWQRLQENIQEFTNPWLLDEKRIIDAITQAKVSVYTFKKKPTKNIPLPNSIEKSLFYTFMEAPQIEAEIEILTDITETTQIFGQEKIYLIQQSLTEKILMQTIDYLP